MKIDEIIDRNDLKLKHITGEYLKYNHHSPDDVVYAILSKNRKSMKMQDIIKIFGEEKTQCIEDLVSEMKILGFVSVSDTEDRTVSLL